MDDPNRPSSSQQQLHQPQPQQQQLHEHDNQQPLQPGADLIEATISTLLSRRPAKPEDYYDILPKFSSQLKIDFENRNLWLRFGLTIALTKESPKSALQAFNECMRIDPDDPLPAMLAAKILLQELDDPEQALRMTDEAINRCKKQVLDNSINKSNGIESLDNNSIEMICSSVSSLSTSNHSSSQSTIIQASSNTDVAETETSRTNNISDKEKPQLKSVVHGGKTTANYKDITPMLSRCYVLASVTHAYLYEREPISIRLLSKGGNLKASLGLLDLAQATNPRDYLVYFHKALHEVNQRSYPKAIDNLRRAIKINPHHIPSIELMILALSAMKLYSEALALCESVLLEREDDLMLLYIKCNLEQCLVETKGYKVALGTARYMLKCIRQSSSCNNHVNGHNNNYSSTTTISVAAQSASQQLSNTLVSSTHSNSTATAASNAAGSTLMIANSPAPATNISNKLTNVPNAMQNPTGDPKQISNLFPRDSVDQTDKSEFLSDGELFVWILVAEIFVKIGSVEDAELCVDEGVVHTDGALSHQVMYIRGLIAKAKNQLIQAKTFFQSCLALCPRHAKALQQIAHVHHLLGNYTTAEKFLRDSLDLDGDCHKTWYYLSLIYIELNQHDRANECVKKSTTLEETAPSVPFRAISRLTLQ